MDRNLDLLRSAATSAQSALTLADQGSLAAAEKAVERSRSQVARIREPSHARRVRLGRSMIDHVEAVIVDAKIGADATVSFERAQRSIQRALECPDKRPVPVVHHG
jgi:myo-inositol catabolism protein IolC